MGAELATKLTYIRQTIDLVAKHGITTTQAATRVRTAERAVQHACRSAAACLVTATEYP